MLLLLSFHSSERGKKATCFGILASIHPSPHHSAIPFIHSEFLSFSSPDRNKRNPLSLHARFIITSLVLISLQQKKIRSMHSPQ